jgi:hypothetical protein
MTIIISISPRMPAPVLLAVQRIEVGHGVR